MQRKARSGEPVLESTVLAVWLFLLYTAGACPTIYVGDSGELVAAIATLGIPHPSGYPLYVLVGKLWTFIAPLHAVAYRMSLASAVFAAGAASVLYCTARREGLHPVAALFGALLFAVSPSFWGEANIQRVYGLNAFFVVASTAVFLSWHRSRSPRALASSFFLCGLGAANHTFMAVQAGVFLLAAALSEPSLARRPVRWVAAAGSFVVGLAPYLYLPLRSRADPRLDWGDAETLQGFLSVVLRLEYWNRAWVSAPLDVVRVAGDYLASVGEELLWAGAALAIWGIVSGRRRRWPFFLPLMVMAGNFVALLFHGSRSDLFIWHRYYIPSYAMAALLAAFGAHELVQRIPPRLRLAPLVLPVVGLLGGFGEFDRSRYRVAEDFGRKVLASLPEKAYLAASGDNVLFPLLYLHLVEEVRPDVNLILQGVPDEQKPPLSFDPDEDALFFTHHPNWRTPELDVVPAGLVFRIVRAGAAPPSFLIPSGPLEGEQDRRVPKDYLTRNLIAHYHYMLGVTYEGRDWPRALTELEKASSASPNNDVLFYNLGLVYARNGLYVEAYDAFQRSYDINPRPLASSPRGSAAARLAQIRRELDRLGAIELALADELPTLGTAERQRALAELLEARGERRAARGYRIRALTRHAQR